MTHRISPWRGSGAIARPTGRAPASPASAAARQPASSAVAGLASGLGLLVICAAVIAFVVVAPLVALLQGGDPVSCLLWVLLYGGGLLIYAAWPERRQPLPKPRVVNYPTAESFQDKWGTTESCAKAEKPAPETACVRTVWIKVSGQHRCPAGAQRDLESNEPQAANASGEAMTRRKGEITRSDLKRKWPIHLALPAEKVRDP